MIIDCGDPGRSISTIRAAVGRGGAARERLGALAAPPARPTLPKRCSSSGWTSASGTVGDDEDLGIVGPEPALLERDQIVAGEALDRRRIADRGASHRDGRAVEQRRQGARRDPVRVLLLLRDRGQRLGAHPLDLASGAKAGLLDDVGQQVERRREVGATAPTG